MWDDFSSQSTVPLAKKQPLTVHVIRRDVLLVLDVTGLFHPYIRKVLYVLEIDEINQLTEICYDQEERSRTPLVVHP